jgi:hypothetical protein
MDELMMGELGRFRFRTAGFTGTRRGITSFQRANLMSLLCLLLPQALHHGDCVGADAEAHGLCRAAGVPVVVHPPADGRFRAFCDPPPGGVLRPARPYLARNRDIVAESAYLIAVPQGERPASSIGSGTWTTVGYAERAGMGVVILHPDGRIQVDETPDAH